MRPQRVHGPTYTRDDMGGTDGYAAHPGVGSTGGAAPAFGLSRNRATNAVTIGKLPGEVTTLQQGIVTNRINDA